MSIKCIKQWKKDFKCLNPYSNGRYSMRIILTGSRLWRIKSLNPYSNGRYSMSEEMQPERWLEREVLILILMEDTL